MGFDIGFIVEKFPYLLMGFKLTFIVSLISVFFSLVIGIIGSVIRVMNIPILSKIVFIFVEFMRNTPLLIHIFILYFGLPSIGINMSAFLTGCISLSLWGGAYAIENFRGGLESVSKNLIEAASSLGMNTIQIYRHIITPIGIRVSFSSFTNTAISVLKNTSYLTAIGFAELTFTAVDTVSSYFKTYEMFFTIGAMYLLFVWLVSSLFRMIERKMDFNNKEVKKGKVLRSLKLYPSLKKTS